MADDGFHRTLAYASDQHTPELGRKSWGSDLWLLLVIGGPNVATTIAQSLMGITDFIIVSMLPDTSAAQAAVTNGGLVFFSAFAMLLGTMICVTTVVSQSLGARRYRDCSAYAWQGFWASAICGALVLALYPLVPALFGLFNHKPAIEAMEIRYTQIRLLSIGFAGATVALANFFNGIHRPGINTVSVIAANVLNAFLSYGLVLGKWGLPAMGVEGAAWGSVIATAFRTVCMMAAMCFGRASTKFDPLHTWRYNGDKMRRLIRIGWPSGAAMAMDIAAWAVFMNWLIGRFGEIHQAATATVWQFLSLSFMPAIGIGMSVSTVVGKAIGQGDPDHARRLTQVGSVINVTYMMIMAGVYLALGASLIRLLNDDAKVVALGSQLLIFAAVWQFFDAFAITYSSALRGAGDTLWPSIVAACEAWIIMVGGGALVATLWPEWESKGPWVGSTTFIIVVGLTLWGRWRRGRWEELDVIGRREPMTDEPIEVTGEPASEAPAVTTDLVADPD